MALLSKAHTHAARRISACAGCRVHANAMRAAADPPPARRRPAPELPQFEALRVCMERNPAAFKEVLPDVQGLAATNTEMPPPQHPAAAAAAAAAGGR